MLHFQFTAMFAQNLCMIISMKVECRILACEVHYASTPDSKGTIIRKKHFLSGQTSVENYRYDY